MVVSLFSQADWQVGDRFPEQYDLLGNHIFQGQNVYSMNVLNSELQKGSSDIDRFDVFQNQFWPGIVTLRGKYEKFSYDVTLGDYLHYNYSDLFFNKIFSGIGWNFKLGDFSLSLITSRISYDAAFYNKPPEFDTHPTKEARYLFGGSAAFDALKIVNKKRTIFDHLKGEIVWVKTINTSTDIASNVLIGRQNESATSPNRIFVRIFNRRFFDSGSIARVHDLNLTGSAGLSVNLVCGESDGTRMIEPGSSREVLNREEYVTDGSRWFLQTATYREIRNEDPLIYYFDIPGNTTNIVLQISLSGSYEVQIATIRTSSAWGNANWETIGISERVDHKLNMVVYNFSESFGTQISEQVAGVKINTAIGPLRFKADYGLYIKERLSPAMSSPDYEFYNLFDIGANLYFPAVPWLNIRYQYTKIPSGATMTTFVDDNDDKDKYIEDNPYYGEYNSSFPFRSENIFNKYENGSTRVLFDFDKNGNRIPDYVDGPLSFQTDLPFFRSDWSDDNNNGQNDFIENDYRADTPVPAGQTRHKGVITFKPSPKYALHLKTIYRFANDEAGNANAWNGGVDLSLSPLVTPVFEMTLLSHVAWVQDSIRDNSAGLVNGIDNNLDGYIDDNTERAQYVEDTLPFFNGGIRSRNLLMVTVKPVKEVSIDLKSVINTMTPLQSATIYDNGLQANLRYFRSLGKVTGVGVEYRFVSRDLPSYEGQPITFSPVSYRMNNALTYVKIEPPGSGLTFLPGVMYDYYNEKYGKISSSKVSFFGDITLRHLGRRPPLVLSTALFYSLVKNNTIADKREFSREIEFRVNLIRKVDFGLK